MVFRRIQFLIAALLALVVFSAPAIADTTGVLTILTNVKKNTAKIKNYYAEMTLMENATGSCVARKAKWAYARAPQLPDTNVFSLQQGTGWIDHSSITGSGGNDFPKYESIFMQAILSDTFPNSWINGDIPVFTASVTFEDNDSIVLRHMNSSVTFFYTVDKKKWVVRRIVAGGYDVYDVTYTWSLSADSVYYPSAIKITQADLCDTTYQFSNIKVTKLLTAVREKPVMPQKGRTTAAPTGFYNLLGKSIPGSYALTRNSQGIYLMRRSDGTMQKVLKTNIMPAQ